MAEPHEETHQEKETRWAAQRATHGKEQRGRRTARYRKSVRNWLQLAGLQGAAVNRHFIRDLHPTQVQVDELWSFVKKNKSICNRVTLPTGVTPGCGVRSPCQVISAS
jgi:hypothetical protein